MAIPGSTALTISLTGAFAMNDLPLERPRGTDEGEPSVQEVCSRLFAKEFLTGTLPASFESRWRIFSEAGTAALEAFDSEPSWIQVGLDTNGVRQLPCLYKLVGSIARELLRNREISNFFFMHKPPGIRLRFQPVDQAAYDTVITNLYRKLAQWEAQGLLNRIVAGIYEPESYLFGGADSMRNVHALFTADSLAWLEYHALAHPDLQSAGPAWRLSLAMLRTVFSGLGISEWEDLCVWERVRDRTGRRVPAQVSSLAEFKEIAAEIRAFWTNIVSPPDESFEKALNIAQAFEKNSVENLFAWQRNYFMTRSARIGPRAAAALVAIFHWNRAGLSLAQQALLTESLLTRETV